MSGSCQGLRSRFSLLVALLVVLLPGATARAARPAATKLLPENTVLVLSVPSAPELAERFRSTGMGRMMEDPELKPLVKDLYGSITDAVAGLKDQIGLSVSELLEIPQGEMTVAVVAPEAAPPAMVVMLDAGDQLSNARKVLARGTDELEKQPNTKKREEDVDGTTVVIYEGLGNRGRGNAMYFEKDSTIVLGTDLEVLKQMIAAWDGDDAKHLADNEAFAAVMRRCRGTKGEEPQFYWFFDPISLMKNIGQRNTQVRVALATLPALGLDGLLGMGGSLILDAGQFDSIAHFHLLLDNPRDGVVEMIALKPGNVKPESWMPEDVVSYMTLHWRFQTTFNNLAELYDSFRGDGALSAEIRRAITDRSGVDVEKDILPALDGRVTYFNWIDRTQPINPESSSVGVALKLKEIEPVEQALKNLAEKFPERFYRQSYAGIDYYQVIPPERPNRPDRPQRLRSPKPCLGIYEGYLLVTDRMSTYEKVLATGRSAKESLADALDFKLIAAKIARQCGGTKPAMISFHRPEEGMRFLYDLVNAEQTRARLHDRAENNAFFKSVEAALEKNPLPPFAVLQQYLAPGGSMVIDDESGIHYTTFTLRRK